MNSSGLKCQYHLTTILVTLSFVSPSWQFTHYVDNLNSCNIVGDSDIYGIGVRISYYLAFWAGVIAILAHHKSAVRDCRKGVNIISFAVFITVIRNTVQGSFALLEWYIVFPMVFLPVISLPIFDPHEISKGAVSIGVWMVLNGIYCLLQPWIWWIKLHQGSRPNCNPQVLIYAFFDLYNHKYVTFGKVVSIIACLGGVSFLLGGIYLIIAGGFSPAKLESMVASLLESTPDLKAIPTGGSWFLGFCFSFSGITLIVFSELVLKRNKVDLSDAPITSTSQLLPLLVGIFTFISTVWSVITDKDEEEGTDEEGMAMA